MMILLAFLKAWEVIETKCSLMLGLGHYRVSEFLDCGVWLNFGKSMLYSYNLYHLIASEHQKNALHNYSQLEQP
jgi:hypothetical protein